MLASLDNGLIFKKAFTDMFVFKAFIKDILGLEVEVSKIETEKAFIPKEGNIAFRYDIFAETIDKRFIIEIQKVDYDYNFDRFLHYHLSAITELQKNSGDYRINREVFTVVVVTAPYVIDDKQGFPIKSEVLVSNLDPKDLEGKIIPIYGHRLVFLNPNNRKISTPQNYKDWLDLFYESIHHAENPDINYANEGIRRVADLINYDKMDPYELNESKIAVAKEKTKIIHEEKTKREVKIDVIKKILEQDILTIEKITEIFEVSEEFVIKVKSGFFD